MSALEARLPPERIELFASSLKKAQEAQSFLRALEAAPKRLPAVDASNELLHRYGDPRTPSTPIASGAVSIRWAQDGELLVTLDRIKRTMTKQDLVIADESAPSPWRASWAATAPR